MEDSDSVTMARRRYSGGATRRSSTSPRRARFGGSTMPHIGPWTWWSQVTVGPVAHSGVSHGTPFQISTSPSRGPWRPRISLVTARGNTR